MILKYDTLNELPNNFTKTYKDIFKKRTKVDLTKFIEEHTFNFDHAFDE